MLELFFAWYIDDLQIRVQFLNVSQLYDFLPEVEAITNTPYQRHVLVLRLALQIVGQEPSEGLHLVEWQLFSYSLSTLLRHSLPVLMISLFRIHAHCDDHLVEDLFGLMQDLHMSDVKGIVTASINAYIRPSGAQVIGEFPHPRQACCLLPFRQKPAVIFSRMYQKLRLCIAVDCIVEPLVFTEYLFFVREKLAHISCKKSLQVHA